MELLGITCACKRAIAGRSVKYRCKLELAHNEARFNNAFDLNWNVMKIITSPTGPLELMVGIPGTSPAHLSTSPCYLHPRSRIRHKSENSRDDDNDDGNDDGDEDEFIESTRTEYVGASWWSRMPRLLCSAKANTEKMKRSSLGWFILRAAAENDWRSRSDPFILSDFVRVIGTEHIRAFPVCVRVTFCLFIAYLQAWLS